METKSHQANYGEEIRFSTISPLELWRKLGLAHPKCVRNESNDWEDLLIISQALSEESRRAFEAFKSDCPSAIPSLVEGVSIPEDKGSLFIWSLLNEIGKRSRNEKKLSSVCYIFKDVMCASILRKGKKLGVAFEEGDYDTISSFLQGKSLIRTNEEGIRITRKFTQLFHEKYHAWLVF